MLKGLQGIPPQQDVTEYFPTAGGLDLVTEQVRMPPGRLIEAQNYDIPGTGGYRSIPGYERFDGRPRPSDAAVTILEATTSFDAAVALGDTLNGQTSGATGKVIYIAADRKYVAVTKVTGSFSIGENIREVTTVVAVSQAPTVALTGTIDNQIATLAEDDYRADIGAPAGSGGILGVWEYKNVRYCWRNNVGGTAAVMYRQSTSGWTAVTLAEEVYFSNANTSVNVGDTLTQGGVTATVRRVIVQTGSLLSGVNTGKLVIDGRSGGNFAAGAATSTGGGALTLSGAQTAQTFPPNGKYSFANYNFTGSSDTRYMYGANGVGRMFEFDGTYLAFIDTGMAVDTPTFVAAHRQHLFASFRGSVQHSGPGTPHVWTVVLGAGEIGIGEDVTGFLNAAGNQDTGALLIFGANRSSALYGSSSANWSLQVASSEVGARAYTAQNVVDAVFLDTLGITSLAAVQEYGNFGSADLSAMVKQFVVERIDNANCSVVVRADNQYKLFFNDGSGVTLTFIGRKLAGIMPFFFPIVPTVSCEGESGRVFFGATNGFVYELGRGRGFDGESIASLVRFAFLFSRAPLQRKFFKRCRFDIEANGYASFFVGYVVSRNDGDSGTTEVESGFSGGGAGWDDSTAGWDEIAWDGDRFTQSFAELKVSGTDISIQLSQQTDTQLPYTIKGGLVTFIRRNNERK